MIIYTFSLLMLLGGTPPVTADILKDNFKESTLCQNDNYIALRELYLSTDGDNWTDRTEWPDASFFIMNPTRPPGLDVTGWYGIGNNVDINGCVNQLLLSNNNLNGTIPPEMGLMTSLITLHLDGNQLIGSIPPEIGNMFNLESLQLNNNQLSGSIPPEFANLFELSTLRLYNNQLIGCYESSVSALCSQLDFSSNTNAAISNGNMLDATWEDFCNNGAGLCGSCSPSLFLTSTLSGIYVAGNDITSDGTVITGNNVEFEAGQVILLDIGFCVQPNADFSAEIEDCGP